MHDVDGEVERQYVVADGDCDEAGYLFGRKFLLSLLSSVFAIFSWWRRTYLVAISVVG